MLIAMKKNQSKSTLTKRRLAILILAVLFFVSSCATFKVKDIKKPVNVDKKISEEFYNYINKKKFFEACRSYIEYKTCCGESSELTSMQKAIKDLYKDEVKKLKKDSIKGVEYSYTLYSLFDNPSDVSYFKDRLIFYIKNYIDSKIAKLHSIEAASLMIYMLHFLPEYYYPYEKLVEIFLDRQNPLMSEKYLKELKGLIERNRIEGNLPDDYSKKLENLENQVKKIKEQQANYKLQTAISNTIDSSVKIVVDRGIKTEGGSTVPDQILGTGVVIDSSGYILTNYHIIKSSVDPEYEGYSKIYVIPGRDESIKLTAEVVGYDRIFDLAVIKVEKNLTCKIKFGDSDSLEEGEQVLAIGNPIGLVNTVTSGIVSAKKRPFIQIGNIIQIDAALNPGNSGGALINRDGYLVGIAFAGFLELENLNFAIPSNLVLYDLFKLFRKGEVKRSWVGANVEKVKDTVKVNYVVPESNAELAGIKPGDIVESVNGFKIDDTYQIQSRVSYFENPVVVKFHIKRGEEELELKVPLARRPYLPSVYIFTHDSTNSIVGPLFGIILTDVSVQKRKYVPVERVIPGSPAADFGITGGDEIKIRDIIYRKKPGIFFLRADIKSKRFGYLGKSVVLSTYQDINSFI